MLAFLRFIGLMNAAVWLGAGVFFAAGVGPAVFSPEMKGVFGHYYVGVIGRILVAKFFIFFITCGLVATAHFFIEMVYARRSFRLRSFLLVGVPLALGLAGAFVLQPKMRTLHEAGYRTAKGAEAEQAKKTFGAWHGVSQIMNLTALVLVAVYTWRVANPPQPHRFVSAQKFRG